MKNQIATLVSQALVSLEQQNVLTALSPEEIVIERTRDKAHGDFATNTAMKLCKQAGMNPRQLAQMLIDNLPASDVVAKVEIAGPGFINFYLVESAVSSIVNTVLEKAADFGKSSLGAGQRVQVEFVSANPTGPLHVGHGRGAAYGSVVSNLLATAGYTVSREYYVNDAGRQMNILAASVWLRYLESCGESFAFPSNGYKGEYIKDIAAGLRERHADEFRHSAQDVFSDLPADELDGQEGGDKEAHIDAIIERAKSLLGKPGYRAVFGAGLNAILTDIKDDLAEFGVLYDEWFSEQSLVDQGAVDKVVKRLQDNDAIYEKNGALWFRSTDYGDEKDRVVQRDNGQTTYFASDIAYHLNKLERGFDRVIDVWGADHHGYVPRVKASMQASGVDAEKLDVLLVQFAILYRNGQKAQMSTRSGEFVTLRELREEVGTDAARFFYVMRKCEQHLDFDLDLAKSRTNENPVYYIQYAHARICSVFRELHEKNMQYDEQVAAANIARLENEHEIALMTMLARYPEMIENAARNCEPHHIAHYLRDLSNAFHTYYNAHKFLIEDEVLRSARLHLVKAVKQVIVNGLSILGVSSPEAM